MTVKTVFSGFGGQGVLLMGNLLSLTAMLQGQHVTYLPAYGAEMRGGTANCTVVVSDDPIASPVASSPDYAVIMNNPSLLKYINVVSQGGAMLLNSSLIHSEVRRDDISFINVPVNDLAQELGEPRSANVIMMGAYAQVTNVVSLENLSEALAQTGLGKKPKVLELNRRALVVGAQNAALAMEKEKSA